MQGLEHHPCGLQIPMVPLTPRLQRWRARGTRRSAGRGAVAASLWAVCVRLLHRPLSRPHPAWARQQPLCREAAWAGSWLGALPGVGRWGTTASGTPRLAVAATVAAWVGNLEEGNWVACSYKAQPPLLLSPVVTPALLPLPLPLSMPLLLPSQPPLSLLPPPLPLPSLLTPLLPLHPLLTPTVSAGHLTCSGGRDGGGGRGNRGSHGRGWRRQRWLL